VLDGEIAVPDERGVTHIDLLQDAFGRRGADRLAYFAFDLLYLDGHDLRRCPIEARKELLRQVVDEAGGERIVYVDHVTAGGDVAKRIEDGKGIAVLQDPGARLAEPAGCLDPVLGIIVAAKRRGR
jgi:ATP-dependent DNA ligase